MTTIAEKHLRSVIPKPRDSDEEDPKVELNEEGEVLNIEAVTERLATDLKLTEFALKDIGEGEGEGEGGEGGDRTDYDGVGMAKKYAEAKTHEWRSLLESYTFMNLAKGGKDGSLIGVNTIVDLACGEGHYTRSLRKACPRATRVVGVDIAEEMIAMAKEKEKNKPIGVKYIVQDVKEEAGAKDEERFDLATAAWLLVYCKSVAELNEMCKAVANYVKPGGRFLTIITNPQMAFDSEGTPTTVLPGETQTNVLSRYAKYGFTVTVPSETPQEGDPFTWSIKTSKGPLVIVNYYLPRGAYKESLEKAGFEKIKFHPFELDPKSEGFGKNFAISPFSHLEDADSNDKKEFYQEFLDYPPALCIECWKSGGGK
tara:strand:+ start:304 stop:1413 length:1110 start_codon:yes stop_codon:yes gene_type:complete